MRRLAGPPLAAGLPTSLGDRLIKVRNLTDSTDTAVSESRGIEGFGIIKPEISMLTMIRHHIFFALDRSRGGRVRHHLHDIEQFYDGPSAKGSGERRLNEILSHASETTDFYANYKGCKLGDFPVITKANIRSNQQSFFSTAYNKAALTARKTSGSYSTPMTTYVSCDKAARQNAELIYFNRKAGLEVGDLYLNITTNKKGGLERFVKNVVIIDPTLMNDQWFKATLDKIRGNAGCVVVGFPSVLYALANYIKAHDLSCKGLLRAAITIAEPLNANVRGAVSAAFHCPIYNRYATMETGVLGHAENDGHMQLNRASYHVEVLSESDNRPVAIGDKGRVVVTDLFSDAFPLIRYEIGDTAVLHEADELGAKLIKSPEGRIVEEIYRPDGNIVSWAVLYDLLIEVPHVIQYQFCQIGRAQYELHLVAGSEFKANDGAQLKSQLEMILGQDSDVSIRLRDQIPPLPSGKRPMVINSYKRGL